ncbi:hypothetical protein EPN15_04110 [Patescibacteria group bacterium]|nr:MAG: hypothetical protein EPN15_04110 [Patescibacteria group bacterium]
MIKFFNKMLRKSFDYSLYLLTLAFVSTILIVRTLVWSVESQHFPNEIYLFIGNTHIHHYTYGFLIISLAVIMISVMRELNQVMRNFLALLFGVGLALITDEFGMWVAFNKDYWNLTSKLAIFLTIAILLIASWILSIKEKRR